MGFNPACTNGFKFSGWTANRLFGDSKPTFWGQQTDFSTFSFFFSSACFSTSGTLFLILRLTWRKRKRVPYTLRKCLETCLRFVRSCFESRTGRLANFVTLTSLLLFSISEGTITEMKRKKRRNSSIVSSGFACKPSARRTNLLRY